jgi:hypothetical protein
MKKAKGGIYMPERQHSPYCLHAQTFQIHKQMHYHFCFSFVATKSLGRPTANTVQGDIEEK